MRIRDAEPGDFAAILALNAASVAVLSPMDAQRLVLLDAEAALHRVVVDGENVLAFLLAFREGAAYDSVNYGWFAARYPRFLYVDRVVVAQGARERGIATLLYQDVFAQARAQGVPIVTCEIDVDPPNAVSARFHERLGFQEVGRQVYGVGKTVALQVAVVRG